MLEGDALDRARAIDALSKSEKDLDVLVTPDTLKEHHFYNEGFGKVPFVKFTKQKISSRVLKKKKKLKGQRYSPSPSLLDEILM